jgi:hypothetical protein
MGAWVGFQVQASAEIDLDKGEVRGFQELIRSVPADPSQPSSGDTSEAFTVQLTDGDVTMIRAILDARLAALGVSPKRTFKIALDGSGAIGVTFAPQTFAPTPTDIQQIMGIVLMRAKLLDTMGVYNEPPTAEHPEPYTITMTVNGAPV